MQARFTRSIGLPVLTNETPVVLGHLRGILIHPDTGKIEGFFVAPPGMFSGSQQFLSTVDILHWGLRVTVRSADVLSPPEELVRLRELLEGHRPVLGQIMRTESGRVLGRCADIQFTTKDFRMQWLFPRRFWRYGRAIPASQILEIRPEAIIVRDGILPAKDEAVADDALAIIPPMPEVA